MRAAGVLLVLVLLAGCATTRPSPSAPSPLAPPTFGKVAIIDPVRSGGEPVLFQTPKGTLLIAAHPGFTHVKAPPGPEVVQPANGQSYLYRSEDDGATWGVVTGANGAPRNNAPGDSDPDLAVSPDGALLVMAQLDGVGISSEASKDDGKTWPGSNALVAERGDANVDRPWVANANGEFYLLYNGAQGGNWRFSSSKDGVAWTPVSTPGDGSYPGALATGPQGEIYVGNGDKVWASVDHGKTFSSSKIPGEKPLRGITAQRPAVDDAGTLYFAWSELHKIRFAASHDKGKTWGPAIDIGANGTMIWPWPAAGAKGKLVVVWLQTDQVTEDTAHADSEWTVHMAIASDADTEHPSLWTGVVPNAIATRGGICIGGTFCEAQGLDRRLGDFITVIVDKDGLAQVAYGTTVTGHSISSPAYVRQVDGPRLR